MTGKAWRGEDEGIMTVGLCEAITARVKGASRRVASRRVTP